MTLGNLYSPTNSAQVMNNIPAGLEGLMIPQMYEQMKQEQALAQVYNKQITDRYNPNVMEEQEIANTQNRSMNPMLLEEKRLANEKSRGMNPLLVEEKRLTNEQANFLMPTHQSAGLQAKADIAADGYGNIAKGKASSAKTNLDIQNAIQGITMLNSGASDEQYLAYVQQTSPKEVPGATQKLKQLGRAGYIKMVTDMVTKTALLDPKHIQEMAQEAAKPAQPGSTSDMMRWLNANPEQRAAMSQYLQAAHPAPTGTTIEDIRKQFYVGKDGQIHQRETKTTTKGATQAEPAKAEPQADKSGFTQDQLNGKAAVALAEPGTTATKGFINNRPVTIRGGQIFLVPPKK